MTGPAKTPQHRSSPSDSAWLVVAAALMSFGVLLAVVTPLITANPTGITGGILAMAAGVAIVVVVRRRSRS